MPSYYPVADVIEVLGNVGEPAAVETLNEFCTHDSPDVRRAAFSALTKIGILGSHSACRELGLP